MNVERDDYSQEKESAKLPTFDTIATGLLEDEKIKELPEIEQGRVIVDRFIGALVRHGDVEGSQTIYSPMDVLHGIDNMSKLGEKGLREITSTDGLRKAVYELAGDIRVGREFGQFTSRLGVDDKDQYVLTSTAQVEGYLLSGGDKNRVKNPVGGVHMEGDSWVPVIMEQTEQMVENPYAEWMSYGRARELMASDAPLIKNTGRDWEKALHSAEKVGVDIDVLRRSAEKIQRRSKAQQDMGSTALAVATGSRIRNYRSELDRRSSTTW